MRALISIFSVVLVTMLTGCVSARPSPKAVGVFKSEQGSHVLLTPEGHFYESESRVAGERLRFIGIASAKRKQPHTVFITTPSAGVLKWMGATLVFSEDFSRFDVFGYEPRSEPTKPPQSSYERVF